MEDLGCAKDGGICLSPKHDFKMKLLNVLTRKINDSKENVLKIIDEIYIFPK